MIVEDNIFRILEGDLAIYGVAIVHIDKENKAIVRLRPEDVRRKVKGGYQYNGKDFDESEILYFEMSINNYPKPSLFNGTETIK